MDRSRNFKSVMAPHPYLFLQLRCNGLVSYPSPAGLIPDDGGCIIAPWLRCRLWKYSINIFTMCDALTNNYLIVFIYCNTYSVIS
ncbi:MAG: hypothetical protein AABY79_12425 [Nitrospirota bacterium]